MPQREVVHLQYFNEKRANRIFYMMSIIYLYRILLVYLRSFRETSIIMYNVFPSNFFYLISSSNSGVFNFWSLLKEMSILASRMDIKSFETWVHTQQYFG